MERLTDKSFTKACCDPWDYCGLDSVCKKDCFRPTPCKIPTLIYRLAQIEDILGDNYDLEYLKKLLSQNKKTVKMQYVRTNLSYSFDTIVYKFYQDGKFKRERSVSINELEEYEKSLKRNGWERAYTEKEIKEMEEDIKRIKEKLNNSERLFEAAKEKTI